MKTMAIIPARGGSKGIPKKNLQRILGVPLISHAVHTAAATENIDSVIVTTDDREIAEAAREAGAEVVMRPAAISGDRDRSEEALLHVLSEKSDMADSRIVFMQCTSPLTRPEDLNDAIRLHDESGADVVFSGARNHMFLWRVDEDGLAQEINHDRAHRPMRQQLPPQFHETGAFYVMDAKGLLEHQNRFFGKLKVYEVPAELALDIDDPDDIILAEMKLTSLQN